MAAHEHLGRQFLERHLAEHHGWHEDWVGSNDSELSHQHKMEHVLNTPTVNRTTWAANHGSNERYSIPVQHAHSPERIHFGDDDG